MNNAPVINTVTETLVQWKAGIVNACSARGLTCSYHDVSSGSYIGEMTLRLGTRAENHDVKYVVKFLRKLSIINGERHVRAVVYCFNATGGLHVTLSNYAPSKADKVADYALNAINSKLAHEEAIEVRRQRTKAARTLWTESGVELPSWMTVLPNVDDTANLGTFQLSFHEHRDGYGMKFLTPRQIDKIKKAIMTVINEPSPEQLEKELVDKLKQHEGKDLKYDRQADDKQWMDLTNNP